jgi:hypothetical protein
MSYVELNWQLEKEQRIVRNGVVEKVALLDELRADAELLPAVFWRTQSQPCSFLRSNAHRSSRVTSVSTSCMRHNKRQMGVLQTKCFISLPDPAHLAFGVARATLIQSHCARGRLFCMALVQYWCTSMDHQASHSVKWVDSSCLQRQETTVLRQEDKMHTT